MDQKNPEVLVEFLETTYKNYKDSTKNPTRDPIHIAAGRGRLDIVQILVEQDPTLLEKPDDFDQTPLLWAAASGHLDVLQYLHQQGAQVNIATKASDTEHKDHGKTALCWAIENNHPETALFLINANADLTKAASHNKFQPIHIAAKNGQLDVIKAILEKNPNLNSLEQPDAYNQTLLLWAAAEGHLEVLTYLYRQGAQINVATNTPDTKHKDHGKTALCWAIENNHPTIIIFLINAGALITPPRNHKSSKINS